MLCVDHLLWTRSMSLNLSPKPHDWTLSLPPPMTLLRPRCWLAQALHPGAAAPSSIRSGSPHGSGRTLQHSRRLSTRERPHPPAWPPPLDESFPTELCEVGRDRSWFRVRFSHVPYSHFTLIKPPVPQGSGALPLPSFCLLFLVSTFPHCPRLSSYRMTPWHLLWMLSLNQVIVKTMKKAFYYNNLLLIIIHELIWGNEVTILNSVYLCAMQIWPFCLMTTLIFFHICSNL